MQCKSPQDDQEELVMTHDDVFYLNMQILTTGTDSCGSFSTETSVVHPGSF